MKAIELFPYWADNRALLVESIRPLKDRDLEIRPARGLRTLGEVLRHVITSEEFWWRAGILGEPTASWRPAGRERYTEEQKQAYRAEQFPTLASILDGLQAAYAPVVQFLETEPAASICEKRRAAWGEDNTLRITARSSFSACA